MGGITLEDVVILSAHGAKKWKRYNFFNIPIKLGN